MLQIIVYICPKHRTALWLCKLWIVVAMCRYIVVSQDDRSGSDVSVAMRRLRQAVVVSMLDAVPSVRSINQPVADSSPVISLGEPPDDLPCLRSSTVHPHTSPVMRLHRFFLPRLGR